MITFSRSSYIFLERSSTLSDTTSDSDLARLLSSPWLWDLSYWGLYSPPLAWPACFLSFCCNNHQTPPLLPPGAQLGTEHAFSLAPHGQLDHMLSRRQCLFMQAKAVCFHLMGNTLNLKCKLQGSGFFQHPSFFPSSSPFLR